MPESEGVGGYDHPTFSTMRSGGSGVARHADVLWVGWLFGVLTILCFTLLIAFGAQSGGRLRGLGPRLTLGFVLHAGVFTCLVLAYRTSLFQPARVSWGGFPESTAVMLFLLYPASAIFNVLYVVGFRRWILTEDDERRYEELVTRRKRRLGVGSE